MTLDPMGDWYSNPANMIELREALKLPILQRAVSTLSQAAAPRVGDDAEHRIRREGYFQVFRDLQTMTLEPKTTSTASPSAAWGYPKTEMLNTDKK